MEHAIYILTSKSNTCFSRLIHMATSAPYTHVSIGLDGLDGDFYSFGRKYRRLMLPAGLVKEGVSRGGPVEINYQMYRLQVSERTYRQLQERLGKMYGQRRQYRYNLLGAFAAYFNYPLRRQSYYFCSQFVAELLEESGAMAFDKNSALVRPIDFCGIENLQLVSEGVVSRLGTGKELPAPSEVVAVLPFGQYAVRAYRFCHQYI